MVAAATLHAFSTEMLVGSMTFSVIATVLCLGESMFEKLGEKAQRGLDQSAYYAAIFSLCCIPSCCFSHLKVVPQKTRGETANPSQNQT